MKEGEPMTINMFIDICTKDKEPIETSLYYLTLVETIGEEKARQWVEELEVLGDP